MEILGAGSRAPAPGNINFPPSPCSASRPGTFSDEAASARARGIFPLPFLPIPFCPRCQLLAGE
eukprot:4825516-Pyramimonas_sp.AAC.1